MKTLNVLKEIARLYKKNPLLLTPTLALSICCAFLLGNSSSPKDTTAFIGISLLYYFFIGVLFHIFSVMLVQMFVDINEHGKVNIPRALFSIVGKTGWVSLPVLMLWIFLSILLLIPLCIVLIISAGTRSDAGIGKIISWFTGILSFTSLLYVQVLPIVAIQKINIFKSAVRYRHMQHELNAPFKTSVAISVVSFIALFFLTDIICGDSEYLMSILFACAMICLHLQLAINSLINIEYIRWANPSQAES